MPCHIWGNQIYAIREDVIWPQPLNFKWSICSKWTVKMCLCDHESPVGNPLHNSKFKFRACPYRPCRSSCCINCFHCEGLNLTEFQSGRLASTDINLGVESWIAMQRCVCCEGQNTTECQPSKIAVVVLPQLASTGLNLPQRKLRS